MVTYYHQHNQLATLSPILNPAPYTKFFIRKEYDDGNFPREFFYPASEYGGRAFTEEKIYVPLPPKIEATIPNMYLYDQYLYQFSPKKPEQDLLKRLLNCAHIRLAPDSHNILPLETLKKNLDNKVSGIILHDYDLAGLKAYDAILELSNQRHFKDSNEIRPYLIGNKFPIKVSSSAEMEEWLKLKVIPGALFFEFYGVMDDKTLYELCTKNKQMAKQLWYNITGGCSTENDFLMNCLPKIFVQVLFLRRSSLKILLTYDNQIVVTPELQDLIELLNTWLRFSYHQDFAPHTQSLYKFCYNNAYFNYVSWALKRVKLSVEQMRNSFLYIRINNYDLFKMFYEWDEVKFDGRNLVNEWE